MPKEKSAEESILALLQKRNARLKFKQLVSLTGFTHKEVEMAISNLRKTHKNLVFMKFDKTFMLSPCPTWYTDHTDLSQKMPLEGVFGSISDTHLCSIADRIDLMREAYDEFKNQGVSVVFHSGDMSDGWQEYRGHINFVKVFGDQEQARYVIHSYPKREGITTYVIQGNHDDSYKHTKVDRLSLVVHGFKHQGKEIAPRTDIVYVGQYAHNFILPQEVKINVIHPRGGNPYAISYQQQKRSENMDKNERPDAQISGHFHKFNFCWLNSTYFLANPGMQDQTEFFARLGYPRDMGFVIVHYKIQDGKFVYFQPQLFMFK